MTDPALVARARRGDSAAFAVLLARHRSRLVRACGGDPDLVQDASLIAWLQLDRLREASHFGAWLAGIGRMLSLRVARERAASRVDPLAALPEHATDERDDPAARLLAAERARELARAIAALPEGQREAVVLFHLADLPQAQVAELLGTRPGAVRTRLHKARIALHARLTETPMLDATILDVRRTPAGRHVVLLSAGGEELPIWIGAAEAEALVVGLSHVELPRPNAYALMLSLLRAVGRAPTSVRISRLEAAIFYAEVVLDDGTSVDARPSDALVLSVAAGLPITVDPTLLVANRTAPPDEYVEDLAQAASGGTALLAEELRARLHELSEERERLAGGAK